MNFTYALETSYVDYIQNNITSSNTYPILRGFDTGSFDYPVLVVHSSDWKPSEGLENTGNMKASLHVCVITNFLATGSQDAHDLVSGEVDRLCNQYDNVVNWINNPSSSMFINGIIFTGGNNVIQEDAWESQYHFTVAGQQMFTTSSITNFTVLP